jgi:uncharacterized protein (UPF0335 family)
LPPSDRADKVTRTGRRVERAPIHDTIAIKLSSEEKHMADVAGVAGDRLKSFIERIERLEEEKKALAEDIKEVYAEAKGTGFDVKIMRQIIRIRKMDKDDLDEQETLLDVYKRALGMVPDFSDEEEPKAAE